MRATTIVALPTVPSEGQELELILGWLLHHGNMRKGKGVACASLRPAETFMRVCRRPTEAACFRAQKCANNRQLIVAGVQRFLQHACAAYFRSV